MKWKYEILFIILWLVLGTSSLPVQAEKNCQHDEKTFRCVRVIDNYDGDTVRVQIPRVHALIGKNMPVRIAHIDTPEIKGKCELERKKAAEARDLVASTLKSAKQITLKNVSREKYFRILADVEVDGKSLASILLEKGLAVAYEGATKQSWCGSDGRGTASK